MVERSRRKMIVGNVISNRMDKTVTVVVERRFRHKLYGKFIANNGTVQVNGSSINIELKKKRDLPQIIEMMKNSQELRYPWLNNAKINFIPSSTS